MLGEELHIFEHEVLAALDKAVPGFRYAYTHSAEFHAAMQNRMRLMLIEVELMTLGAQSRAQSTEERVRRLERGGPPFQQWYNPPGDHGDPPFRS